LFRGGHPGRDYVGYSAYDTNGNLRLDMGTGPDHGYPVVLRRADAPAGTNVTVSPSDGANVTFSEVLTPGDAGAIARTDPTGTLPSGFRITGSSIINYNGYVDVLTNASPTGAFVTCMAYPDVDDDGIVDLTNPPLPEALLRILHAENGVFVDRTVSRDPVNNRICAQTSSLSEFVVGTGGGGVTTTTTTTTSMANTTTTSTHAGSSTTTTTTTTLSTTTTSTIPAGCSASPKSTCRAAAAGGSKVTIKDRTPDTADQVSWKWKGQATALGDFGDPLHTTGYELCIYQGVTPKPAARAPAGDTCGSKPCWKALGTKGFAYKDGDLTPNGLLKVTLKAGDTGKAQVSVKGKGANLPDGVLPLTTPVTVQLQATTGQCWTATFGTAQSSDSGQFKAKSD
jgi:hypothetical protein